MPYNKTPYIYIVKVDILWLNLSLFSHSIHITHSLTQSVDVKIIVLYKTIRQISTYFTSKIFLKSFYLVDIFVLKCLFYWLLKNQLLTNRWGQWNDEFKGFWFGVYPLFVISFLSLGPYTKYVDKILKNFDPLCRQVYYTSVCSRISRHLAMKNPLPLAFLRSLFLALSVSLNSTFFVFFKRNNIAITNLKLPKIYLLPRLFRRILFLSRPNRVNNTNMKISH